MATEKPGGGWDLTDEDIAEVLAASEAAENRYQPYDGSPEHFGSLEVVDDPGIAIQREAENALPLGFCSPCVTRVKGEFISGAPVGDPVRAAVTLVAHQQLMRVPGSPGPVMAVLAMPTCWECIALAEAPSNLMNG